MAVLTTWALRVQVPEPIVGLVILALGVTGAALGASELAAGSKRWRCHRLELGAISVALITTLVVLGQSVSVQAGVPDYVHDGAFHTEMIDALRRGSPLPGYGWYPSGFHAPAAALLSLVPAVDSASGAVGWAVGVTLLAPLAMFGFTRALWTDTRVAYWPAARRRAPRARSWMGWLICPAKSVPKTMAATVTSATSPSDWLRIWIAL